MDSAQAMAGLRAAVAAFRKRDQASLTTGARGEELAELRRLVDALELEFSSSARTFQVQGGHQVEGAPSAVSWLRHNCKMSSTSAADRLCVGKELESLPKVAEALAAGEIGYQSTSVLCHLRDQLDEKRELFVEDEMLELAKQHTVKNLRTICLYARHVADPDGFFKDAEEDFSRRRLQISQMADGMHVIDGVLDSVGGAAVKTALEALTRHFTPDDVRSHSQRMADALVELTHHALDEGRLPSRGSVKPHVSLTATLEALKGELGAPAVDVELSLPVSARTLERFACDCTMSRVLLADSQVIDVGRATRVVSGPTRRALKARDQGCRWPGCDRPVGWTSPHHIRFWTREGGPTNLPNLVSVCHFHDRQVHEGGWKVVKVGRELQFLPPDRQLLRLARGPGVSLVA
jgi:uncharacterized protein DUF222